MCRFEGSSREEFGIVGSREGCGRGSGVFVSSRFEFRGEDRDIERRRAGVF